MGRSTIEIQITIGGKPGYHLGENDLTLRIPLTSLGDRTLSRLGRVRQEGPKQSPPIRDRNEFTIR